MKIFMLLTYCAICLAISMCFKKQIGDWMYLYGYTAGCIAMMIL